MPGTDRRLENLKKGRTFQSGEKATIEAGRRGGVASGEAKRKRKAAKRAVEEIFAESLPRSEGTDELLQSYGLSGDEDAQTVVLYGLALRAARGDVRAAEFLFGLIGEGTEAKRDEARLKLDRERLKILREDLNRKAGRLDDGDMPVIILDRRPVEKRRNGGSE